MENLIRNEFKLKYDGELNQIDANTLINSLLSISRIIHEINSEINPKRKIEIKIKALSKGSFLIHFGLEGEGIEQVITNLFSSENITYASFIIASLVGLIKIHKFLKGKKPKQIKNDQNNTTIENENGTFIQIGNITYNLYEQNSKIKDAISDNFDALYNDISIKKMEITDANDNVIESISRDDFEDMSVRNLIIEENQRIILEIASLNIFKVVFEENYVWEFYYKGNKIKAQILDKNFFSKIDNGESFAKGDILKVELQINQIYEPTVKTFINKSYKINRVIQHEPRVEQQKLRLDTDFTDSK